MKTNQSQFRDKYRAIVLWCKQMGSYDYYIDNQVEEAEADKAPVDAIYKRDKWVCVSDLPNFHPFRDDYEKVK